MPSGEFNLQVLANPCFYVYYLGMLEGSVLVISLIPPPQTKKMPVEEVRQ
jgi:hypothetical protein